jgi:putative NADH-flavin reductase
MARLLIIGASQGIGLETVKAALAAGHTVRAFSRFAGKISLRDARLETVNGDALDPAAIARALTGQDAVIQSLGVSISPDTIINGTRLFSNATRILIDAMTAAGTRRLVAVTGISAGNSRDCLGPFYGAAFQLSLRRIYDDKDVQEMMIQRSTLDWTIVRPGFLTEQTKTPARALLDPKDWRPGPVSRSDVAAFIIAHLDDPVYLRQTPLLIA